MNDIIIRRFIDSDVDQLYEVIRKSLTIGLISKVYEPQLIEIMQECYTKKYILGTAKLKHVYVAVDGDKIVGSIATNLDGNRTYISMVYIDADCQGKGIGRKLIQAAEADEYSLQTKDLYLHAILSACKFYQKMGYHYPNGFPEIVVELSSVEFATLEKTL